MAPGRPWRKPLELARRVRSIPRRKVEDSRGWLLKFLEGTEEGLPANGGESYITLARPGQARGGHYHPLANEWFTVLLGESLATLVDPIDGERLTVRLQSDRPKTLYVPAGIAHQFLNSSMGTDMVMVAFASRCYEPADTIPFDCSETL
jgi:dTDP-4-dehydrorhamnose 3,5-epimerase-like enzyme